MASNFGIKRHLIMTNNWVTSRHQFSQYKVRLV